MSAVLARRHVPLKPRRKGQLEIEISSQGLSLPQRVVAMTL